MWKNGDLYSVCECVTRFLTNQNRTRNFFFGWICTWTRHVIRSGVFTPRVQSGRQDHGNRETFLTPGRTLTHLECWIGRLVELWCGLVPFWNWAAPRAAALSRLRSKPRPESLELSQLLTLADDDEDDDDDDPTGGGRCCCCCCCRLNC